MKKTIRAQIMFGYMLIITVPIIITLVTVFFLFQINSDVKTLNQNRTNQNATKDAVVGHYSWLLSLESTLQEGKPFTGSLDPKTCGLGTWMESVSPEDLKDQSISSAMASLKIPHNEIHTQVQGIIDLSKTDKDAAYLAYSAEIQPKVANIIADISTITNKYKEFAEHSTVRLTNNIIALMISCIVLVILGVSVAIIIGRKTSKRISKPIEIVADYSRKLALGYDDLSFAEIGSLGLSEDNEASTMIKAFERMVKGIQGNVAVVKRVAEGDLTAYVDIRSQSDSLGQNLYHMVQSNDLMFGQILQIASEVASSANQISTASNALASSATRQASSTEQLSTAMLEVNALSQQNSEKVAETIVVFDNIRADVGASSEKMTKLVVAVDEIRMASDKISAVIKTIEDIAFQTNILALNAAVEAARAGVAGKGFAVVADEVRNLASKSAKAADETKGIIENTIKKAYAGSAMAKETGETFGKINANLIRSADTVSSIAHASDAQALKMETVKESIDVLVGLSTTNAASCEESSAASAEMHRSAGTLRQSMEKFNLRQRQYGKAYIPIEKQNDQEFIRTANENYQKSLEQAATREKMLEFVNQEARGLTIKNQR